MSRREVFKATVGTVLGPSKFSLSSVDLDFLPTLIQLRWHCLNWEDERGQWNAFLSSLLGYGIVGDLLG